MSNKVHAAYDIITRHLCEIARDVFKPGVKLTFIARTPGMPEADMFISEDDLDEVAAVVDRSTTRKLYVPEGKS